jgi:hypothetical protein
MNIGDSTPPTLGSSAFEYNVSRQRAKFTFSEDVSASLSASSLHLTNLTTNQTVPNGSVALAYDAGTNTATFTFPGFANGVLPDGNYRATIPAGSVSDASGNLLGTDITLDFFTLGGDANHDRHVDVSDLGILATNWQASGRTFSQGDFNYDNRVDVTDLGILATAWQKTLAAPAAATNAFATTTTIRHPAARPSLASELLN